MRAVPSSERPVPSALLDPLFRKRPMPSAAGDVHAAVCDVPSPAEDLPFAKRAAHSSRRAMHATPFDTLFPERPVPSAAGDVHTQAADGVVAGEARYAALAKRSAQTADRLLRRVSRHRAKGK